MCRLSDQDLRMAGTRNMMDLMWAAVKEPIETHISFDREGLNLAFKYFTCSTLTIRLTGITQINVREVLIKSIALLSIALSKLPKGKFNIFVYIYLFIYFFRIR